MTHEIDAGAPPSSPSRDLGRNRRPVVIVMALYAVVVVLVLLVPSPVDRGLGQVFSAIRDIAPWATQHRIQVGANVAMFAPVGWALATWSAGARAIALPLSLVLAVTAETIQAELLPSRDGDIHDIIANVTGACIGIVFAIAVDSLRRKRSARSRVASPTDASP